MAKCTDSNYFQLVKIYITQDGAVIESALHNFYEACHFHHTPQRRAVFECTVFYFLKLIVALHFSQEFTPLEFPRWDCVNVFSKLDSLDIKRSFLLPSRVDKHVVAPDAISTTII